MGGPLRSSRRCGARRSGRITSALAAVALCAGPVSAQEVAPAAQGSPAPNPAENTAASAVSVEEINALLRIGDALMARERFAKAEERYQAALRLSEIRGDIRATAESFERLGRVAAARGEWFWAAKYYGSALNRYEMLTDLPQQARLHFLLASVAAERGNMDAAEDEFRRALYGYEEAREISGQMEVLNGWAKFERERGDDAEVDRLTTMIARTIILYEEEYLDALTLQR